jgi:hypothetical protein
MSPPQSCYIYPNVLSVVASLMEVSYGKEYVVNMQPKNVLDNTRDILCLTHSSVPKFKCKRALLKKKQLNFSEPMIN